MKGSCAEIGPPGTRPNFSGAIHSPLLWGNRANLKTQAVFSLSGSSLCHLLECGNRGRFMVASANQGGHLLLPTMPKTQRSHSQSRRIEIFSTRNDSKISTHLEPPVVEAGSLSAHTTPQDKCLETRSPPIGHTHCPSHQNGC